jgi:hypothetical protein
MASIQSHVDLRFFIMLSILPHIFINVLVVKSGSSTLRYFDVFRALFLIPALILLLRALI